MLQAQSHLSQLNCFYSNAFLEPTGSTLRTLTKSPHFFTEVDPVSGSVVEETKALEL